MKAENPTKREGSRFPWVLKLVIGLSLINLVLTPVVLWFVIKWFWPGLRIWHYVLFLLCLLALVALAHWFQRTIRLRSHRTFLRRMAAFSEDFAHAHNLMLEICQDSGAISFRFRHPKGGRGAITLQKYHREKPVMFARWQYYDYDSPTTGQKEHMTEVDSLEQEYLNDVLAKALEQVLSWQDTDLTLTQNLHDHKETLTREQFESFFEKYPFPKLD
jgi:hypothetical protein